MERCHSSNSVSSSYDNSNLQDTCRICHSKGKPDSPLISPCDCSGSLRYVHQSCLRQWISNSNSLCCEICKFHFITDTKMKSFNEWEKPAMTAWKRRKLLCSITVFVFTIVMMMFHLYILIKVLNKFTAAEEKNRCAQEWPFCAWMILVAISFLSGFVCIYFHCTKYIKPVKLFRRWRELNSNIYVQNAPENGDLQQHSLGKISATAQSIACIVTSEESKRLSSDEEEFHSCQMDNNSTSNSNCGSSNSQSDRNTNQSGSSMSLNVDDTKNTSGEILTAWTCFTKVVLTSLTDSGLEPVDDTNHPANDIAVTSLNPASSKAKQNLLLLLPSK